MEKKKKIKKSSYKGRIGSTYSLDARTFKSPEQREQQKQREQQTDQVINQASNLATDPVTSPTTNPEISNPEIRQTALGVENREFATVAA